MHGIRSSVFPICFVMAQSTIYHNDKYEFNKQRSACAVEMCHAWH